MHFSEESTVLALRRHEAEPAIEEAGMPSCFNRVIDSCAAEQRVQGSPNLGEGGDGMDCCGSKFRQSGDWAISCLRGQFAGSDLEDFLRIVDVRIVAEKF